jgi:hypothetical protein
MKNKALCAFVLIFAAQNPAVAQDSAPDLAKKLASRIYVERENAAKKLEQLGTAALPALKASLASADLETKRRAQALIERIEDRLLREQTIKATPMRIQFTDTKVNDALRQLRQQTGLAFSDADGPDRVNVDSGAVPYWQAWRAFRAAAKLNEWDYTQSLTKLTPLALDDPTGAASMLERSKFRLPTQFVMPAIHFTTEAGEDKYAADERNSVRMRVKWESITRFKDDGPPHAVLAIEVRPEPRLNLTALPRVELTKIIAADGREHAPKLARLYPAPASMQEELGFAHLVGEIHQAGLLQRRAFPWMEKPATMKEVHGRVRLEVSASPTLLEIPSVMKNIGVQTRGEEGLSMKIVKVDREERHVHLRLRVENPDCLLPKDAPPKVVRVRPGVVAVLGAMDVLLQRLEVRDARGWKCKELESSYQPANNGNGYIAYVIIDAPQPSGDDLTLVLTKEVRRIAVEMPFVVRDVKPSQ